MLPLSPGRAERHGFEDVRHGTLSLYAALNVGTGEVAGMTAARHTSADFLVFLERVVATQPRRREIHLIADNLSAHKTKAVQAWLAAHPRVHLHYTPTYSSWLNQVELWLAQIERDCIARGIFTSTADLRRTLLQYIRAHNTTCHPFVWSYADVATVGGGCLSCSASADEGRRPCSLTRGTRSRAGPPGVRTGRALVKRVG